MMEQPMSTQEQQLCQLLADLPSRFQYRFTEEAKKELLRSLFWSLAGGKDEYMQLLFPNGNLPDTLKLGDAQGAVEGAEYTEAARGKRCGHIFKAGEASYMCRTCGTDETCCLCSRCFESTDHTGHMVRLSISAGNSGCCDCGDDEAWTTPLFCTIHSNVNSVADKGKSKETARLPQDLTCSIQMTIGRAFDYICDVISCSPEQLRHAKTHESIKKDEQVSRLSSSHYFSTASEHDEYALILWNDEKHTVQEVEDQVARACRKTRRQASKDAWETDSIGRSILTYSRDIDTLLKMSSILEAIRITVTIRSSRDTFREQMCGAIIEWLSDISGCSVGTDHHILRQTVCEEVMKPWKQGDPATHTIGQIDDEDEDDQFVMMSRARIRSYHDQAQLLQTLQIDAELRARLEGDVNEEDVDEADIDDSMEDEYDDNASNDTSVAFGRQEEGYDDEDDDDDDDVMMIDARGDVGDLNMNWSQSDQALEEDEATMAGYPPPPPPPPAQAQAESETASQQRVGTPSDSDPVEAICPPAACPKANLVIPQTPGKTEKAMPRPGPYWIETPSGYVQRENVAPAEDVFQRVRLDWLLLFDLRMWKKARNDLRSLYISTIVLVPEFKRVLALRFSSLYTILAQLYLVGDREPDHSIINISLQVLTTPSITAEVVERGNFMSSLFAILYTFLTTRQVGHPWDVSPDAVLGFESGSVTNRRMYHFYQDLKYLFGTPHVQERIRCEPRYLMQFLDLVKLHQCIGPNVRAVVEHVEYEADSWITASLVTRQINLLARSLTEAFRDCPSDDLPHLQRSIRFTAKTVILSSIGADRLRFKQAEIKDEVKFKTLTDFEFSFESSSYDVVQFVVEKEQISFHHALHYTLSWLIECGRSMSAEDIRTLMSFTLQDLRAKPRLMGRPQIPKTNYSAEDYLMAAFDYPLRVCAWLSQIKANMWVRNGISLRHQASTYKGVMQRDVSHHRDVFMLQVAMVICNPSRVLASIIDRFGMEKWVKGLFEIKSEAQDDSQHLDVVEDMIHLLIVMLSDRTSLIAKEDEPNTCLLAMRRDIIHVLCFKPLSFNEICNKLPEKYPEQEDFHDILNEMATFKPPEGVSDVGTFELRPEFIQEIDPYIAHYNRNQREEAEMAYRKKMAKKTGKSVEEIVYEPKHHPIPSGLFKNIGQFTGTGMFAQIIYYSLLYPLVAERFTPSVLVTRLETFLQVVLHLMLMAIHEDKTNGEAPSEQEPNSFVHIALTKTSRGSFMPDAHNAKTIVSLLHILSAKEAFKSSHPKIALVLKRLKQRRQNTFQESLIHLGIAVDRIDTASPANASAEEERERRKKAALSRQARVMAQFQRQQQSFMDNQGEIDWGSDLDEDEESQPAEDRKHNWKYPTGTCILCQEEADDRKLYGTFALLNTSRILRQTDFENPALVREALQTPCSLDRSAEDIRPFGIARENRVMVEKFQSDGSTFLAERQTIGQGFDAKFSRPGPVASGCGHMMHYRCFEQYYEATARRHNHQIARHHPENTQRNEFVCPLCKALGNAFLPIVWKGLEECYPSYLEPEDSFDEFLVQQMGSAYWLGGSKAPDLDGSNFPAMHTPSVPGSLVESITQAKPSAGSRVRDESGGAALAASSGSSTASADMQSNSSNQLPFASLASSTQLISELKAAYRRLKETLRLNDMDSRTVAHTKAEDVEDCCLNGTLALSVGYTISSVEIQQRGIEAQPGMTLLEKIPEQTITHLRILSETVSSFMSVMAQSEQQIETEFNKDSERQHCQLFISRYFGVGTPHARRPLDVYTPLLSMDPFIFLVECSFGFVHAQKAEIAHVLRLCYLAELVKIIFHMSRNMPAAMWLDTLNNRQTQDSAMNNFAEFALNVTKYSLEYQALKSTDELEKRELRGFQQPGVDTLEGWYIFAKKYALTFLRKSLVFLHVKYGVDFNSHVSPIPEAEELDRLTEALRVPNFDEMCAAMTPNAGACGWPDTTQTLVSGWIKHQVLWPRAYSEVPRSGMMSHPGIFELIGLPKTYDTLIEEATRNRCPTTGKELTDPVLCLFCGALFCSQGTCCQRTDTSDRESTRLGGAQQHMQRCQQNIGVFLNIRKCSVFYLFRRSGSFTPVPYIDKYGETDPQLRHGRQLFLNQKRYDSMIRNTILNHGVPSLISRKLEAEINNGGWDTF